MIKYILILICLIFSFSLFSNDFLKTLKSLKTVSSIRTTKPICVHEYMYSKQYSFKGRVVGTSKTNEHFKLRFEVLYDVDIASGVISDFRVASLTRKNYETIPTKYTKIVDWNSLNFPNWMTMINRFNQILSGRMCDV